MFCEKIKFLRIIESLALFFGILGAIFGIYKITHVEEKFAEARNVQRSISVETLIDALYAYQVGNPISSLGKINLCTEASTKIGTKHAAEGEFVDLQKHLKGSYLPIIPKDPSEGTDEDTGYTICLLENHRIRIEAPRAELGEKISIKR